MEAPKAPKGIPDAPKSKSFGQKIFSPFGFARGAVGDYRKAKKFRANLTSQQKSLNNQSKKLEINIKTLTNTKNSGSGDRQYEMQRKINALTNKKKNINSQKQQITQKLEATPQPDIGKTVLKTAVGAVGNVLAIPTAAAGYAFKSMTREQRRRGYVNKALENPTSKYATNPKYLVKATASLKKKIYQSGNKHGIIAGQFEQIAKAQVGKEKWTAMTPTERAAAVKTITGVPFQVSANGTKIQISNAFKKASTPEARKQLMTEGSLGQYELKRNY